MTTPTEARGGLLADDNVEAFVHITTSDVGIFKEWLGTIVLDGPNGHDPEPPYYDFDQDLANLDAITPYGQTDLSNGLLWVSEPYFLDHLMMVRQTYAGELQQEQAMADILMEDLVQAGAPITAIQADISNGV